MDFLLDVENLEVSGDAGELFGGNVLEKGRFADAVAANEAKAAAVRDRHGRVVEHDEAADVHRDLVEVDVDGAAGDDRAEFALFVQHDGGARELGEKLERSSVG